MDFIEFVDIADMFSYGENITPYGHFMITLLVGALCFLVMYAFQSVALYTVAKRGGYGRRWMAFVPVLNTYYIGVVSEKNKIFNMSARRFSLVLAIAEFLLLAVYAVYYISSGLIFAGGLYTEVVENSIILGQEVSVLVGYESANVPSALAWAGWFFDYADICIIYWIRLVYIVLNVFVVMAFFQTYTGRHYFLFTIFSVLFPIKGILMFVVRNNAGRNYREYIQEQQKRRFQMYQQYNRNSGGNPYNYNPYTGQPINRDNNDPYQGASGSRSSDDPFDGMGSRSGEDDGGKKDPGDPFGDL